MANPDFSTSSDLLLAILAFSYQDHGEIERKTRQRRLVHRDKLAMLPHSDMLGFDQMRKEQYEETADIAGCCHRFNDSYI